MQPTTTPGASLKDLKRLSSEELVSLVQQAKTLKDLAARDDKRTKVTAALFKRYKAMKTTNAVYRKKLRLADSNMNNLINVKSRLKKDQVTSLCRRRGMKRSPETIRDALVFKMKMGTRAYSDFVQKVPIYLSARTLQKSVQHMKFESGIQYDILRAAKDDIALQPEGHRTCVISGDEMAIQEAEV